MIRQTVVKTHDYIALGLIAALDAVALPRVGFVFVLENVEKLFEAAILEVEVSADGYRWVSCVVFPFLSPLPRRARKRRGGRRTSARRAESS